MTNPVNPNTNTAAPPPPPLLDLKTWLFDRFESLYAKGFPKSFKPKELYWFPIVVFTAAAFFCLFKTDLVERNPVAVYSGTLTSGTAVLVGEYILLHTYEKVEASPIMNQEFGIAGRATVNCVLYSVSAFISALNEKSPAGALFFYSVSAALLCGERLMVKATTDLGLFYFLIACGILQSFFAFRFGFLFWVMIGLSWFMLSLKGFVVDTDAKEAAMRNDQRNMKHPLVHLFEGKTSTLDTGKEHVV